VNRAALPDGYEVPLHRSLTEPIMMGGAPRTVAISVGTLAAAVGMSMRLELSPEARTEISSGKLPVISRRRDLGPSLSAAGRGA